MSIWIKICGVTSVEDALVVAASGADAVGLNFSRASLRYIEVDEAARIVRALHGRLEIVGVFVDSSLEAIAHVAKEAGLDTVQLHGHESPEFLDEVRLLTPAYKALRIGDATDVVGARRYGGERLLTDAKVKGAMGGTGHAFDWSLLGDLCTERQVILAGGLRPDNVSEAVQRVRPYGIDTASGVEDAPGRKSPEKVAEFVLAARRADAV